MALTPTEAVQRLANASKSIAGEGSERALTAAGVEAKKVMGRAGDRLSGYGRGSRRGRVDPQARFDPQPGLKITVEPTKATKGLWAILEHGSDTTWQFPKRRGKQRRAGTYSHRPVRARHTWTRATPTAADAAFRAYHRNIVESTFRELRRG
jgi:hypothetical protein